MANCREIAGQTKRLMSPMAERPRAILICSCEDTMPLDGEAVRRACRDTEVIEGRQFCRAELERFRKAAAGAETLVVACTQEAPLFSEVAGEIEGGAPLGFVNIRETAGWSEDAAKAGPKVAALIAAGAEPAPDIPFVPLTSEGITLLYGRDEQVIEAAHRLSKPYRVRNGKKFRLKDVDPGDTGELKSEDKARAKEALQTGVGALTELQDMLYGQDRWSLLLIFQAMDAAGKDGTIKHVMSGVNPQGCQVSSFKAPTSEDLDHDYLWRCQKALPERGRIGIFNRSYYEETLVVRVHPEFLAGQKLPQQCVTKDIWDQRFQDIRGFERYLTRNGTIVRKFFLHVSKKEQQKRFLERIDLPEKNWKFSANDAKERGFWDDYMKAYEETIRETATEDSPWYVVPADNKWFTRVVVAAAVIDALASLDLCYPKVSAAKAKELAEARKALLASK